MTITFVTNLVNHHQLPLADELYSFPGIDYKYIVCEPLPDWLVRGGYDPTLDRPYIIRTYDGENQMRRVRELIDNSEVVIIGSAPKDWVYQRKKDNKITFHYHERWLKHFTIGLFSPMTLYKVWKNYTQFRNHRTYMLCASAYTSKDVKLYGAFPHKCFKWGYFTKVDYNYSVNISEETTATRPKQIMWCSRFLSWKHPEIPIKMAAILKTAGYSFVLDMFGSGELLEDIKGLAQKLKVSDVVNFCGNKPNDEILQAMRSHEIFLFTSDRNEGWGAVLNESMSNGCAVVASNEIGSVPYLIKDGENGFVFNSGDVGGLAYQVERLFKNPKLCLKVREAAVHTMKEMWSPRHAAKAFVNLITYIIEDRLDDYRVLDGPASWA